MMRLLCALAVVAALPAVSEAQAPTFRAAVEAVRVDVSVVRGVTPVTGLSAANFALVDSGVPQTIDSVSVDTVPLNIVLALDTSGSLSNQGLAHLVEAARGLVQMLKPEDSAALLTFDEPAHLRVPMIQDRAALLAGLGQVKADGATALYDAVFLAMQIRPQTPDARAVMLIFSDGRDTASWLSRGSIIEATRRSGVIAHVVELKPDSWQGNAAVTASQALDDIADAAGGRRWSARSSKDLRELFVQVLEELRSRYLLTYFPTGVAREGWHDVKVTLKGARGDVIARPGYFVPPQ
jgi:VWFA-related protein